MQTITHSVKHTIQDGGTIQILFGSHLKDKDIVDHHLFKDHPLVINSIRELIAVAPYDPPYVPPNQRKPSLEDMF